MRKPDIREKIGIRGIKRSWLFNNIMVTFAAVLIGITLFSVIIKNYYYTSVQSGLITKANTATGFFVNYITDSYSEYYDSAYRYIDTFEDASSLELQFVNTNGRVVVSSYGITAGSSPATQDIEQALAKKEISAWVGKDRNTGEKIMAVSAPIIYSENQVVGIMRYVTGTSKIDRQIVINILAAVGVGVIIMLIIVLLNMYFIRSVIAPMKEVTNIARRIADGSYGIQVNRKYQDEIGEMVDAINEMSMKISQTEKAQTGFMSSVSHELRTPLTAITGWGETLMYEENLDEETKKGVNIILKEARRLTKMVEELLEFTRMEDGRFTLNIEPIDVGAELEDSLFAYREILQQDEIEVSYEPYTDELPLIYGDPERLRQVFLNLFDNAAKYGRAGKRINVKVSADVSYITIVIRDYGPGVPEDELENVKMKFYKGSSKERGNGIGLAVCDEIIKYHGGTLMLTNAGDGESGLVVTIRLPIDPIM